MVGRVIGAVDVGIDGFGRAGRRSRGRRGYSNTGSGRRSAPGRPRHNDRCRWTGRPARRTGWRGAARRTPGRWPGPSGEAAFRSAARRPRTPPPSTAQMAVKRGKNSSLPTPSVARRWSKYLHRDQDEKQTPEQNQEYEANAFRSCCCCHRERARPPQASTARRAARASCAAHAAVAGADQGRSSPRAEPDSSASRRSNAARSSTSYQWGQFDQRKAKLRRPRPRLIGDEIGAPGDVGEQAGMRGLHPQNEIPAVIGPRRAPHARRDAATRRRFRPTVRSAGSDYRR